MALGLAGKDIIVTRGCAQRSYGTQSLNTDAPPERFAKEVSFAWFP